MISSLREFQTINPPLNYALKCFSRTKRIYLNGKIYNVISTTKTKVLIIIITHYDKVIERNFLI